MSLRVQNVCTLHWHVEVPSGEKYIFVKDESFCLFKSSLINTESKIMVLDTNVVKQLYFNIF